MLHKSDMTDRSSRLSSLNSLKNSVSNTGTGPETGLDYFRNHIKGSNWMILIYTSLIIIGYFLIIYILNVLYFKEPLKKPYENEEIYQTEKSNDNDDDIIE